MKNKNIINLDHDIKIKIWIHYYCKQLALIHFPLEFSLESKFEPSPGAVRYPLLGVYTLKTGFKLSMIRNFDDFCNEPDDRVSHGLIGYYYRFADEIFAE
jgi:hypothetical protein